MTTEALQEVDDFVRATDVLPLLELQRLGIPLGVSFLARNARPLSALFRPDAQLYDRALGAAYCGDAVSIEPALSECLSLRVTHVPNLSDAIRALKQQFPSASFERPALRVGVCELHEKAQALKVKASSNCAYFQYWRDFRRLQRMPARVGGSGVVLEDGCELLIRQRIIDKYCFLLLEFTVLCGTGDAKFELTLAHAVANLSEIAFGSAEIPSSQQELPELFRRIDDNVLTNREARLFKALRATEKRQLAECQQLSEQQKQGVFSFANTALPVYRYGIFDKTERLEASADKVTQRKPFAKYESVRLHIRPADRGQRNRLARMPIDCVLYSNELRFLDHAAALVAQTLPFFGAAGPFTQARSALKFIACADPPPLLLLKGVMHYKNSVALHAAACIFREQYMACEEYQAAQETLIQPTKYQYEYKIVLRCFARFLDEYEGKAIGNCGFVRPGGEWAAISREFQRRAGDGSDAGEMVQELTKK